MKKGMILSAALSMVGLMLVSCAGEPEATTTTTRQTTVTAPPPVPASRTTTTTTHTGGYWLPKPVAVASAAVGRLRTSKSSPEWQATGLHVGRIRPTANRWLQPV